MAILRPYIRRNIKKIILLSFPILLLPVPIALQSKPGNCAYGFMLMAIFWILETMPLPVTALLPVFVFPLLGVSKVKTMTSLYFNDITFVLIGGLSVAIAIEKWDLHKRIALRLLLLMGSQPKWLMLGFMLITCFLSLWISNTATTSMMIPIAQAVLVQLMKTRKRNVELLNKEFEISVTTPLYNGKHEENGMQKPEKAESKQVVVAIEKKEDEEEFDFDTLDPSSQKFCKAFCMCICYASNCGGIGTLTGTGANLVMKGQADLLAGGESVINYTSWFIFGFPIAFINCMITWVVLQIAYFGVKALFCPAKKDDSNRVQEVIRKEYNKLGDITFAEKAVLGHFIVMIILWFSRNPEFFPGWGSLFEDGYHGDSVPAMMIMVSLFIFPSRRRIKDDPVDNIKEIPPLLDWKTVTMRMPWNVALLIGGGFALARACSESGLSVWLANQMSAFQDIDSWLMIFVISLIASFATEVTSNTATSTLIVPIFAELAIGMHKNPIYIMLPAAISTSFAFMLPVATPPNTIAFSYGYLKVMDMVKIGFILNLLCVVVLTVAINTYGMVFFKLDEFPDWAEKILKSSTETTSLGPNITTSYTDGVIYNFSLPLP
ncbi:solute carrier family 13 member 2-like [Ostrea edulis]|uniref:solute carrier family 13 member 2-like n=1 Tax=Ostrea edulis TaxID=37623 RepID=UPI0020948A3E|nr:solute carrier family 13 member 2-like [Ostrea edulis]